MKAYDEYEPTLRSGLRAACRHLCSSSDERWATRRNADHTERIEDGQTRALFEFLRDSMTRVDNGNRRLFDHYTVTERTYQLARYLRDCCNKQRYNSVSQSEQLADAILYDEFLAELERLMPAPHPAIGDARRTLRRVKSLLFQQAADASDIVLEQPVPEGDRPGVSLDAAPATKSDVADLRELLEAQSVWFRELRNLQVEAMDRIASYASEAAVELSDEEEADAPDTAWTAGLPLRTPHLTTDEAREELVALRWRIWSELGTGPKDDGILRKRLLDTFVRHRIRDQHSLLSRLSAEDLARVDERQWRYLPDIFAIIRRISSRDAV